MKKFTVTFKKEFDAYDLQDCENRLLEFFQLAKSEYVESEIMPEFKYEERKAKKAFHSASLNLSNLKQCLINYYKIYRKQSRSQRN